MKQYLKMLELILKDGVQKDDRTGVGTIDRFGHQLRFDLDDGFPLVTTKKIHLKSIIYELLWMLKGDTNIKYLQDNGVTIWDEWADENGELGPVYGSQWRNWEGITADQEVIRIDQISQVIDRIKTNPMCRRLIVNAWNVSSIPDMNLPPCHCFFQFNCRPNDDLYLDHTLDLQMYIRSWDVFLGGPFNIAQYALLLMMIAQVTNNKPGTLIITAGSHHIYRNHIDQVNLQLSRRPKKLPTMIIDNTVKNIEDFDYHHFELINYKHHPHIKGDVAV